MTQILCTKTLIKIYTLQENKSMSLFHKENKLCFIWGQLLHVIIDYLNSFAKSRLKKLRKEFLYLHVLVLKVNSSVYCTNGLHRYIN